MCLVIAIILGVVAFNAYNAGELVTATLSAAVAAAFLALMVRNIRHLIKLKREGKTTDAH